MYKPNWVTWAEVVLAEREKDGVFYLTLIFKKKKKIKWGGHK